MWLFLICSCLSAHHVLSLSDADSEQQRQAHAKELTEILSTEEKESTLFFASQRAGRLGLDDSALERALVDLLSKRYTARLRAQAAWALGEMGRESKAFVVFVWLSMFLMHYKKRD